MSFVLVVCYVGWRPLPILHLPAQCRFWSDCGVSGERLSRDQLSQPGLRSGCRRTFRRSVLSESKEDGMQASKSGIPGEGSFVGFHYLKPLWRHSPAYLARLWASRPRRSLHPIHVLDSRWYPAETSQGDSMWFHLFDGVYIRISLLFFNIVLTRIKLCWYYFRVGGTLVPHLDNVADIVNNMLASGRRTLRSLTSARNGPRRTDASPTPASIWQDQ